MNIILLISRAATALVFVSNKNVLLKQNPTRPCDEIYPDDRHKTVKSIKLHKPGKKKSVFCLKFNELDIYLKAKQNYPKLKAVAHTSSHCLQHRRSFMHERNPKGKRTASQNIPSQLYMEGMEILHA